MLILSLMTLIFKIKQKIVKKNSVQPPRNLQFHDQTLAQQISQSHPLQRRFHWWADQNQHFHEEAEHNVNIICSEPNAIEEFETKNKTLGMEHLFWSQTPLSIAFGTLQMTFTLRSASSWKCWFWSAPSMKSSGNWRGWDCDICWTKVLSWNWRFFGGCTLFLFTLLCLLMKISMTRSVLERIGFFRWFLSFIVTIFCQSGSTNRF